MAVNLPPFPANAPPGGFVWQDWWKKFQDYVKDITDVAGSGSVTQPGIISGITNMQSYTFYWTAVANYLIYTITVTSNGGLMSGSNVQIDLPGAQIPNPIRQSTCSAALFGPNRAQNAGNGIARINRIYMPDFTAIADTYEEYVISGQYFIS